MYHYILIYIITYIYIYIEVVNLLVLRASRVSCKRWCARFSLVVHDCSTCPVGFNPEYTLTNWKIRGPLGPSSRAPR